MGGPGTPLSGDQPTVVDTQETGRTRPDADSRPLPSGAQIGRYMIVEPVGAGGMGVVYAAYDPSLDRKVALKLLHEGPGSTSESSGASRLLREAQAMAKLSHPNLIAVHDVGLHEGRVFLAMAFIEGRTLRSYIKEQRARGSAGRDSILRAFCAAGRGLQAAHDAGIVHRDFKPDNVLVDVQERIYVADFGLARRGDEGEAGDSKEEDDEARAERTRRDYQSQAEAFEAGSGALDEGLTRTGAVLGTPAYIPPETYLGRKPDPRSDQFSFCVALYQALYGTHPFRSPGSPTGAAAMAMRVIEGELAAPPGDAEVPAWLHELVVRGLRPAPSDRHSDMASLVAALEHDPSVARRRRMERGLMMMAGVAAVGLVWSASEGSATADPCAEAGTAIEQAWSPDRAASLQAHFEKVDPDAGPGLAKGVQRALDAYTQDWTEGRQRLCRDSQSRGPQQSRLLDLRTACYEDRQRDLQASLELLDDADLKLVRKSSDLAQSLPGLEACEDADALLAKVPLPEDPQTRREVEALRAELSEGRALRRAGRMSAVQEFFEARLEKARALDYAPLTAEILDNLGHARGKTGNLEGAMEVLEEAVWAAEAAGDDERVARITLELGYFEGWMNSEFDKGEHWLQLCEAKLDRLEPRPNLQARLYYTRGAILTGRGDIDGAEKAFLQSGEIAEKHFSPTHPRAIGVITALGNVAFFRSDYDKAEGYYLDARERYTKAVGAIHPVIADLETNIGNVAWARKDYETARKHYLNGLDLLETLYGEDDTASLDTLSNLAAVEEDTHNYEAAEKLYRRALDIVAKTRGKDHVDGAVSHSGLGNILHRQERYEEALEAHREALRLRTLTLGKDHPETSASHTSMGRCLMELGRWDEALAAFDRSIEIKLAHDQTAKGTAYTRTRKARVLMHMGKNKVARKELELALEEHASKKDPDQHSVGATWFRLAKLEQAEGDKAAAREAGLKAQAAYATSKSKVGAEVEAFLAKL